MKSLIENSTEVRQLLGTWWLNICGIEYDLEQHNEDGIDQDNAWNNCVSPAICTFLGLSLGCFPDYYLKGTAQKANLNAIPPELNCFFLSFLYDAHDGYAFVCDPEVWKYCLEIEGSSMDLGVSADEWIDAFHWMVELTPLAVHPVSSNHYSWKQFASAIHLRRLISSLPMHDGNNDKRDLATLLRQSRVVVGNDSRLIDTRIRSTKQNEGRYAAFLFDEFLYSIPPIDKRLFDGPTTDEVNRIGMLLKLEQALNISIPREVPPALRVDINRRIDNSEDAELLLHVSLRYPLPCRYLNLPPNKSRLKGVYIKD